jgi:bifunctional DNase/RNase
MDSENIQVDIMGLSPTPGPSGGGYALILKEVGGERRLPIIIGSFEAQHIALELEGIKPPRPLTHDLLKHAIETLGFSVNYVVINELRDGTFFAKIKIDVANVEEIDARPSDAIALALKFAVPIYVTEEVMNEVSFLPEKEDSQLDPNAEKEEIPEDYTEIKDPLEKKLQRLRDELKNSIQAEDYEKAAHLRDEIKKLELSR